MPKQMSGRTSIWWITDPSYNPDAPQAALLTPARNISCAIEQGYTLGPTTSDTDDSSTICDNANTTTFTLPNYEGSLTMFREGDLAATTTDFAKAWSFFKAGTVNQQEGYLVRRVGYTRDVPATAGQEVSSFRFIPDNPQDVDDASAPVRFTVDFKQQAKMALFKALV
jgi:hypothetical protein